MSKIIHGSSEHYEQLLKPKAGQWVVVASRGHFSKCEFGAGLVRRVVNWNLSFNNSPLGRSEHKLSAVWAICANELEARELAVTLREAQRDYIEAVAVAKFRFWNLAAGLGCKKEVDLA